MRGEPAIFTEGKLLQCIHYFNITMPYDCVAFKCKNKRKKDSGITFHKFPQDEEKRRRWIHAMRRENWEPSPYSRLCSIHFNSDCFEERNERRFLKWNAYPTIFEFPKHLQKKEKPSIGGINSLRNAYILLCSKKECNSSLSSEEIVNSCSFETSNKFNPRSLLRSSEHSVTAAHENSIETSSPASLQKQLDLAQQKIKDLQNYITELKEQNVKLHSGKQSTLIRHLHNIRRDAVEANYDAIVLLNQIVHYAL